MNKIFTKITLSLTLCSSLITTAGKAQIINTVVGSGYLSYSGDGGQASAAQLNSPQDVAVDAAGNLYIADEGNNVIRKVTVAGVISTLVGNGNAGYSGDGGQATAATLNEPSAVAVDAAGNIYISDKSNHCIRKVSTAGIITTIAGNGTQGFSGDGGQATAAQISYCESIALDASGNLYISDELNYRIRMVNTSGIITTIAGDGSTTASGDGGQATAAGVFGPIGITVDPTGNLYIVDESGVIRKVDQSTGIISTFAGNATYSHTGDGGQATAAGLNFTWKISADGNGNLYLAEVSGRTVRKIDASGIITTIAGNGTSGFGGDGGQATAAQLSSPIAVTSDVNGNIFIVDNVIRKINTSGIISTYAGNGVYGFGGDGGLATAAELYNPYALSFDAAGSYYITDIQNNTIRKVDAVGIITTIAGKDTASDYSGDGGLATDAKLNAPYGLAVDAAGNLFIADNGNYAVRKVDAAGIITTVAGNGTPGSGGDGGQATAAQLNDVEAVAVDAIGNLYIVDKGNSAIRMVNLAGIITTVAGNMVLGSDYLGDGGQATDAALSYPTDITFDAAGNLYIADNDNNVIRKVNTAGIITTVAGSYTLQNGYTGDGGQATDAQIDVRHIAIDAIGNLYLSDDNNDVIRKINSAGIITTIAGDGSNGFAGDGGLATAAEFNGCEGIAFDDTGNLFIADSYNHRVREITCAPTLSLTANSYTICSGSSQTFSVSMADTYTWTAPTTLDNSHIANPTSSATATTVYTVTAANGGCSNLSTLTETLNVNVSPIVSVNSPTICAGQTATLTVNGNVSAYVWSNLQTGASIMVTPTVTTTYTVTAIAPNTCTTAAVSIVDVNCVLGIQAINAASQIVVYPNPSNGIVTVELGSINTEPVQIEIVNTLGQVLVYETTHTMNATISIQEFTAGVYFVKVIQDNNNQQLIKLIKN